MSNNPLNKCFSNQYLEKKLTNNKINKLTHMLYINYFKLHDRLDISTLIVSFDKELILILYCMLGAAFEKNKICFLQFHFSPRKTMKL